MGVERLAWTRWHYLVLGISLLSIISASVLPLIELLKKADGVSVASRFAEGYLFPDYDFCFLSRLDELKGKRASELRSAKKLALMFIEPFDRQQVDAPIVLDCGRLPVMPNVEQIRIAARHVRDLSSLRRHPKLSRILLDSVELVDNSGRVLEALDSSDLPDELEVLRLQRSSIRDVSNLSRMKKLKYLNLCLSEVEKLPMESMPLLEEIHLIGAPNVTSSEVARFSSLNPKCRVRFGWKDTLLHDLKYADRVQFPSGEVRGRTDVEKLLSSIEVKEKEGGYLHPFDVFPPYIFFQGKHRIGRLSLKRGVAWEFWPAAVPLTTESTDRIFENDFAY